MIKLTSDKYCQGHITVAIGNIIKNCRNVVQTILFNDYLLHLKTGNNALGRDFDKNLGFIMKDVIRPSLPCNLKKSLNTSLNCISELM